MRRLLDFDQPIGLLLAAVLHFVPTTRRRTTSSRSWSQRSRRVATWSCRMPPRSFPPSREQSQDAGDVYKRHAATPPKLRSRPEIEQFFTGVELLDPGVVWLHEWRPDPGEPAEFADEPQRSGGWAGVGRKK